MNLDLDALNAQLSEQGYKLTRQRRAVVEELVGRFVVDGDSS